MQADVSRWAVWPPPFLTLLTVSGETIRPTFGCRHCKHVASRQVWVRPGAVCLYARDLGQEVNPDRNRETQFCHPGKKDSPARTADNPLKINHCHNFSTTYFGLTASSRPSEMFRLLLLRPYYSTYPFVNTKHATGQHFCSIWNAILGGCFYCIKFNGKAKDLLITINIKVSNMNAPVCTGSFSTCRKLPDL